MKHNNSINLKTKIILASIIISVVPLIIVGVLSYRSSKNVTEENISDYTINITEQIASNVDNYIHKYNEKIMGISFSYDIQKIYPQLLKVSEYENMDMIAYMDYQSKIEDTFYDNLINNKNIGTICFFPLSKITPISAGVQLPRNDFKEENSFQKILQKSSQVSWENDISVFQNPFTDVSLTLLYPVKNREYNKNMGILTMSISVKELTEKYANSIPYKGIVYIVDNEGRIISSNMSESVNAFVEQDLFKKVELTNLGKATMSKHEINGKLMQVAIKKLENNGWYLINALPYDQLMEGARNTLLIIVMTIVVSILGILLITNRLSRYISEPISDMREAMRDFGKGDFEIRLNKEYSDEFGELATGFNTMVDEINMLQNNEKKVYMEMGKARFLKLQAQINPHFIYNTLDSINWMANRIYADNIALMTTSLAGMLRFSMDKNVSTTSVANEIENLTNYVKIQQQRYNNKLNIVISIEDQIKEFRMIKLILQPLVENCIYHAFHGFNETCKIEINGSMKEKEIIFEIIDNGIGMDDESIERYKHKIYNNSDGYGLSNIIQRLDVYYGNKSHIDIESQPKKGTQIRISIPVIEWEDTKWSL